MKKCSWPFGVSFNEKQMYRSHTAGMLHRFPNFLQDYIVSIEAKTGRGIQIASNASSY